MSLSSLRRGVLNAPQLLFWLFLLSFVAPLQAQLAPGVPVKAHNAAPPFYSDNVTIQVAPDNLVWIGKRKPGDWEVDAEARVALRIVGTGDDAILRPFWVGQADFWTVAQTGVPGHTHDIYDPQKYLWTVSPAPVVPVAPPVEQKPALVVANIAAAIGLTFVDPPVGVAAGIAIGWDQLPDSMKAPIKLSAQEAVGLEQLAVDGRPLGALKTTVSRPDKHFYWDLGESQSAFPHTTDTQVVFTNDTAPDARGPVKARINWLLPTRTIYDVEIDLWDWTTSEEAPPATVEEWQQKLLTDDKLVKELVTDTAIEVVSIIPISRAAEAGGKIAFRLVLKNKAAARVVAGITERAVLRATTREVIKDGVKVAPPAWWKSTKIRARVRDFVRRGEPAVEDAAKDAAKDMAGDAVKNDVEPESDGADDEDEGERDDEQEEYIAPHLLYFYTQNPQSFIDSGANRWTNPNNRPINAKDASWPAGYYLTDIAPDEAEQLRNGQLSFALFGQPYEWENGGSVSWVRVCLTQQQWELLSRRSVHDPAVLGGALRGRGVYNLPSASNLPRAGGTANPQNAQGQEVDDNLPTQDVANFVAGNPSVLDVPEGNIGKIPSAPPKGKSPGSWSAGRGSSTWNSTELSVRRADARFRNDPQTPSSVAIEFSRNYPDFSSWVKRPAQFPNIIEFSLQKGLSENYFNPYLMQRDGTRGGYQDYSVDIVESDRSFAIHQYNTTQDSYWLGADGQPDLWKAWLWRKDHNPILTWHHHEDMKRMLLIPAAINNDINHQGGASFASRARW